MSEIEAFEISASDEALADLQSRLEKNPVSGGRDSG